MEPSSVFRHVAVPAASQADQHLQRAGDEALSFWQGLTVEHFQGALRDMPTTFYDVEDFLNSPPAIDGWDRSVIQDRSVKTVLASVLRVAATIFVLPFFASVGTAYHLGLGLANWVFALIAGINKADRNEIRDTAARGTQHLILSVYNLALIALSPWIALTAAATAFGLWPNKLIELHNKFQKGWTPSIEELTQKVNTLRAEEQQAVEEEQFQPSLELQQLQDQLAAVIAKRAMDAYQQAANILQRTNADLPEVNQLQLPLAPQPPDAEALAAVQHKAVSRVWAESVALKIFPLDARERRQS